MEPIWLELLRLWSPQQEHEGRTFLMLLSGIQATKQRGRESVGVRRKSSRQWGSPLSSGAEEVGPDCLLGLLSWGLLFWDLEGKMEFSATVITARQLSGGADVVPWRLGEKGNLLQVTAE